MTPGPGGGGGGGGGYDGWRERRQAVCKAPPIVARRGTDKRRKRRYGAGIARPYVQQPRPRGARLSQHAHPPGDREERGERLPPSRQRPPPRAHTRPRARRHSPLPERHASQGVQHTTRAVIAQGPAAAVACPGRPAPHVLLAGGVPPKHTEGIETRTPWSPSCSHQACGASQRARWTSTGNSLARGKPQRPRARDQRTAHARAGGALHRATPVATAEWDGAVAPLSSVRHE